MNVDQLRALSAELGTSAWAFAALGYAFELRLFDHLDTPRTSAELAGQLADSSQLPSPVPAAMIEQVLDVAAALGVVQRKGDAFVLDPELVAPLKGRDGVFVAADFKSEGLQTGALLRSVVDRRSTGVGWTFVDPPLVNAQGTASASFVPGLVGHVLPQLAGLVERLGAGGRILDIGTGVGGLAIELCRALPAVEVVGVDPLETSLAEARQNVARAELGDRITLRRQRIEEVPDRDAFDLVWLPGPFIDGAAIGDAAAHVRAALRPGGWVLFPLLGRPGADLGATVSRLKTVVWGGDPGILAPQAESVLNAAGFSSVRTLGGRPTIVVGQKEP